MRSKSSPIAVLAVLLTSAWFLVADRASAITLVPPSLEYTVRPGENIDAFVKIINEEATKKTLFVSSANFTAKDETGVPNFLFNAPSSNLASWITMNLESVEVEPQRTVQIPFRVSVPLDAEPGGYYAGLFFGSQPAAAEGASQVGVGSKIGTLLIMRVEGEIIESAVVKDFSADIKKSLANRLPVTFSARIKNTGNVHVRPTGTIIIKNMFGRVVKELQMNDAQGAVLPDSTRRFDAMWSKGTTDSTKGGFFKELRAEWKNFAVGKYTATFAGTYGSSKQALSATATFTVWPWELLLVFSVGLIVVIVLLVFFIKWYNGMIIRKALAKNQNDQSQKL